MDIEKEKNPLAPYDFQREIVKEEKKDINKKIPGIKNLIEISEKNKHKMKKNYFFDLHLGKTISLDNIEKVPKATDFYLKSKHRKHHLAVVGTTGVGKTRLAMHMIAQDILAGNSVLVIDPKYDESLFARVVEAATVSGRLDELIYFNPVVPELSAKLNLLYSYYMPEEIIEHVVAGVKSKEEYFENVAYELTTTIVLGLYALAKAKNQKLNITFYDIKKWCSYEKLEELYTSLEYLTYSQDKEIKQIASDVRLFLEQIRNSPADFFAKVSSSLRTVLTSLSASAVGDVVGKATYNEFITRLENGKSCIIYCNTGVLLMRRASKILGRIIISMIQSLIGRMLAMGKVLDPPLVLYLDEGQNALYRGVEELFAKGRAANVWINFFTQSIASIKSVIGEDLANVIIDNISTWIFMRVNCEETASYIKKLLPQKTLFKKRFVPGGEGAMVLLSQEEDSYLDIPDIIGLPQRKFILKTPEGNYYLGEVSFVQEPNVKILFPYDKYMTLARYINNETISIN